MVPNRQICFKRNNIYRKPGNLVSREYLISTFDFFLSPFLRKPASPKSDDSLTLSLTHDTHYSDHTGSLFIYIYIYIYMFFLSTVIIHSIHSFTLVHQSMLWSFILPVQTQTLARLTNPDYVFIYMYRTISY